MLRNLALKSNKLTISHLKKLNNIAHSEKFLHKIKILDKRYADFENFLEDLEITLNSKIAIPGKMLNLQDKIFEGITNRLDCLYEIKNIAIRIYLESQKKPKYFLTLSKSINLYFSKFLNHPLEIAMAFAVYGIAFNSWIEDNEDMDKTMAVIGNTFDYYNRFKSYIAK